MHILAAILVIVFGVVGVVLTVLTLPGTWLAVAVAIGCKLWQPQLMSWWVIGAAAALATLAEVVEFGASAVGTAKAGGSSRGGVGSLVGGLAGAIFGAPFFLGLGAIPGAVIGAGLGALLAEKAWAKRSWMDASKSGTGAALGRLVASILKVAFATAIALLLTIAVVVGYFTQPAPPALPDAPPVTGWQDQRGFKKVVRISEVLKAYLPLQNPPMYADNVSATMESKPSVSMSVPAGTIGA